MLVFSVAIPLLNKVYILTLMKLSKETWVTNKKYNLFVETAPL